MFAKLGGIFQGWLGTPLKTGLFFWLGGFFLWLLSIINWDAISKLLPNQSLVAKEQCIVKDWANILSFLCHLQEKEKERYIVKEWVNAWDFLRNLQESELALLILILISLILLSGALVKVFQFKLLRLCEGYGWFPLLRNWRTQHYEKQYQKDLTRWKALAKKTYDNSLTVQENWEYAKLNKKITPAPRMPQHRMPTRLGNILRGYEQRSDKKYGLDSIICWSRLWLVLPESTQKELSATRDALDEAIQLIAWGILFFIWTIWSWFAPSIALFLICLGYLLALKAADIYGQLIEATFDVHRHLLYEALRLEMPKDPEAEKQAGLALTGYLWRGSNNKVTPVESAVG